MATEETRIENWQNNHILKLRDFKEPTVIDTPDNNELRNVVEPWLTALFQSEHLTLLTGAGISSAVHFLATGNSGAGMGHMELSSYINEIKTSSEESAKRSGRGEANIEDEIRTLNELIRGLEIVASTGAKPTIVEKIESLKIDLETGITKFANAVLVSERNIVASEKEEPAEYLMNFLLSFASRIATRERLNIFTTNYDRIIEFGSELAGLHLIDRFVGNISPIFRSSRLNIDIHYNPPGIRGEPRYLEGVINFTKLHGSIDWIEKNNTVRRFSLPYGAENIKTYSQDGSLMIYPNPSKDRETAEYPYVELFRDFASSVIRPNSTIVTYGYSFGDDHINRVLLDLLTIPSTHLVIIAFNDIGNRIKNFYARAKRPVQISIMLGNHFGDLKTLVDYYLPKPAIDRTTYRMVDLLKARGTVSSLSNQNKDEDNE
ncbi:MAG: SIR2 family protein [Bacteroidales bacterium]|nr:SIR2 family protein [Bacteroidales bacterium]